MFTDCVYISGYRLVKACTAQKLFLFSNVFDFGCDLAGHLFLTNDFCGASWSLLRCAVKYWPIIKKKPKPKQRDNSWEVLQNQVRKDLESSSSPAVLA